MKKLLWKFRKVKEVHVEAAAVDQVWYRLERFLKQNNGLLLALVTPREYPITKQLYNLSMKHERFKKTLASRYQTLLNNGIYKFAIHVHFTSTKKNLSQLFSAKQQYRIIEKAKQFFEQVELPTTDFLPGGWVYNIDTLYACKALGITNFHCKPTGRYIHDWELS